MCVCVCVCVCVYGQPDSITGALCVVSMVMSMACWKASLSVLPSLILKKCRPVIYYSTGKRRSDFGMNTVVAWGRGGR